MKFGDLRSMIHRGELPPLPLPEEQQRYAERLVGERFAARAHRMRLAEWMVYAEAPLNYKVCRAASKGAEGFGDLLRWYACDVASEAMRLYGNGDSRSLRAIEVSRKYVLGEVGEEELKRARQAARAAASDARAAVRSAAAAAASSSSSYAYYAEARANLEGWFRCYSVRWIEEGDWWK